MSPVAPRRLRTSSPLVPIGIGAAVLALLVLLWSEGVFGLLRFGSSDPSTEGFVAVPTPARTIPAYTRVTRDHLWDPQSGRLAVVFLPPEAVTHEMLVKVPDVLGRVLNHEKLPGYVFTNADFMPAGTREGIVAGIPAGKRALRIPTDNVEGLFGLHAGDHFDLVATMPIEGGRGGNQGFGFGGIYAQQLALEAQLSNWQKQATVQVIVQNGMIVEPMTTRQIPVAQSPAAGGGTRVRPVQEVVIAIDPGEVARLTEAMVVQARIWMVPRSGSPDEPVNSRTPDLRPVSPFAGTGLGTSGNGASGEDGAYRVVETIMGQKRELTAVPQALIVLAQFALIVFAMFGVLSLIIDVGYARMTQAQMQHAADAAALEGLRKRDVGARNPANGQVVNDPFASDCQRRTSANRLVHWVFDDDLDAANGDPDYQFGAGPIIDVTDGQTNLHALAGISVPEVHSYKPDLQLNQINVVYGDMVSGRFCYTEDPAPSEDAAYAETLVCTEAQRADDSYARNDFNPSATSPQPPSTLGSCPAPDEAAPEPWPLGGTGSLDNVDNTAFLVRLRRSNEFRGFTDQAEPSVASSGPSLPLVFGRGTTIFGDNPLSEYSPRRDGVTVRATAIASARPALHVGLPQANPAQPGVTPFALSDTFVQTLNAVGVQVTINPINGLICRGLTCLNVTPATAAGRYVDTLVGVNRAGSLAISTVGRTLPAPTPVACAVALPRTGYGPVYSLMASGVNRVVGFSRITLVRDPTRPANPCAGVIARGVSQVAPTNATAVLAEGLPLPIGVQPAEVAQLVDKNLVRNGAVNYQPLLVPVLAR